MKLTWTLSVYMLFSMACGPSVTHRQIDPAFTNLFIKFMNEGSKRTANFDTYYSDNITVVFDDLPYSDGSGAIVGYCEQYKRLIRIDRKFWNELNRSDWIKEALLFHELGHCLLGREHTQDAFPNGVPKSLMFPDVLDERVFNQITETYYLDELFASR